MQLTGLNELYVLLKNKPLPNNYKLICDSNQTYPITFLVEG